MKDFNPDRSQMLTRNVIRYRKTDTFERLYFQKLKIFQTWESNHIRCFTLNHQHHQNISKLVRYESISEY